MGMTDPKINAVLDAYERILKSILAVPSLKTDKVYTHALEMIPKVKAFLTEARREKAFRWLGFLQGIFYTKGYFTIEQLADHNRPTKAEIRAQYPDHPFGDSRKAGDACSLCDEYEAAPEVSALDSIF